MGYSNNACSKCGSWVTKLLKSGICRDCVNQAKRKAATKVCKLEECTEEYKGPGGYCVMHTALTKTEKERETARLKKERLKKESEQ